MAYLDNLTEEVKEDILESLEVRTTKQYPNNIILQSTIQRLKSNGIQVNLNLRSNND